jgi:small GTP-binding protein
MGLFDKITGRVSDFFDEVRLPPEVGAALDTAQRLLSQQRHDEALDTLRRVESRAADVPRFHHLVGLIHADRGAPADAVVAFERAARLREHPDTLYHAALAHEQLHDWRAAHEHLRRACEIASDQTGGISPKLAFELHLALGRVDLKLDRPDRAIKELRLALRQQPDHTDALALLAHALLARQQIAQAREALDRIPAPHAAPVALLDAQIAEAAQDWHRARASYEAALARADDPHGELAGRAMLGIARCALQQGDTARANTLLVQALDHPNTGPRAAIYVLLGELSAKHGDHARALEHFEAALRYNPAHGAALRGAGDALLARHGADPHADAQAAAQYFERSLRAEEARDLDASRTGLGRARLALGDLAGARQLLDEVRQRLQPGARQENPYLLHALGQVALASGDPADALVSLREAAALACDPALSRAISADLERAIAGLQHHWTLPDAIDSPSSLARVLQNLQELIAADARLVDFLPATQRMMRAISSPLSVAILGEFNAGKSTLINALLGEEVVPMGVLPTTAHTGILQYGPRRATRVIYNDGRDIEMSLDQARSIMKSNAQEIDHLEYTFPHPELRAVHYWDTPGFNALDERHEAVAKRVLAEAEAILWVMDANQVLSQTEFEHISSIPNSADRLIIVINKIDRLGSSPQRDEDVADLIQYVKDNVGQHIAGCYGISALDALKHAKQLLQNPNDPPQDTSGFEDFREHLHTKLIGEAAKIKTGEGVRHLRVLLFTLGAFQQGLLARYKAQLDAAHALRRWLDEEARSRPRAVAERELMELEDQLDFALRSVLKEVEESLRPRGFWTQRMSLTEEDRAYIAELLRERFQSLLDRSEARVLEDVAALEQDIAQRTGPILAALSVLDARGIQRRLEGFYEAARTLRLLLEERVYGRLAARATGQIEGAADAVLLAIEDTPDSLQRRGLLRKLLPDPRLQHFAQHITDWYAELFDACRRLCDHLQRDMTLLEQEARTRYDISALKALVGEDDSLRLAPPSNSEDSSKEDRSY